MNRDGPIERPAGTARLPEVDVIKATGIAVIPLIHSLRALWDGSISSTERWLLFATRFAVPGFLFASGYLVAGEPVSARRVGERLRRLVVPYLVATTVAEMFFALHGRPLTAMSVALDVLFGNALGPYYYVFVACLLILAWPLFSMTKPGVLALIGATSVVCQFLVELGMVRLPIPWVIRNPFLWCGYFLWGWAFRRRREPILAWLEPRRRPVTGALAVAEAAALVCAACAPPGPALYVVMWLNVYVTIALLYVVATRFRAVPYPVRVLSDVSYAVYLYHLLVIYAVWNPDRGPPGAFGAAAVVASSLLGVLVPVTVAVVLRRAIGRRSRLLFGG